MVEDNNDKNKLPDMPKDPQDGSSAESVPQEGIDQQDGGVSDHSLSPGGDEPSQPMSEPHSSEIDTEQPHAATPAAPSLSPSAAAVSEAPLKAPRSARQAIEPETPPPPPSRSKIVRNPFVVFLNFILSVLLLGAIALGGLLYFGKERFIAEGPLSHEKTILVSRGTGLGTIADILLRQNVISNRTIFEYGVRLYQQEAALKAGEYLFRPGMSMHDVMKVLTSGKSILHAVTIPEGYTSFQVVETLKANEILVGEIETIPAEGTLLPDTYKFSRGDSRQDLLDRMVQDHDRVVEEIWKRRVSDLPLKTKEEMVILASIVEKETGQANERSRVAGVFVNRLNLGMKLQSDPTVIYGIFGGEGKPKGRPIFRSDLNKKTDYNTYQIPALTPGPIANPGRASLEAVANPSRTKDLFFVADGTGGHAFAETLDEHNQNVRRWRQIEKQRIEKQKKTEADQ